MAITVIDSVSGASSSAVTMDTTGADGIVVALSSYSANPATGVTDNKSNTYTGLTAIAGGGGVYMQMFYCAAPTVGASHDFSSTGGQFKSIAVIALAGTHAVSFYDGTESTAAATQAGSITPSEDDCITIAGVSIQDASGSGYSIDGGYTLAEILPLSFGVYFGVGLAYLIQTSAAATNPTWTLPGGGGVAAAIAGFRSSGGGGGGGAAFPALTVAI